MAMQPTYGPCTDNTHRTTGGNRQIVNGQECEAIVATYEPMENVSSPLGEDDSHVMGEWATAIAPYGGS